MSWRREPWRTADFVTASACCCCWVLPARAHQIPLYVWLPDAMAGPTPVSALIHAATMVTAGVYMMVRTYALWEVARFIGHGRGGLDRHR